ncbi:MAG: RHS repeat-associated core domain-containing protein [Chloroflexi bacterium]|nr:RHS repeat-associated core domain-containing protein [Chloroflexota bacterium]
MRKNGALYFLLSDHSGSTSLTTNASGNVISELRYTAWGEVRYNSGVTPTQYQFTGQMSYTESFGLMYYGARWYDPYLNRFAQADSIVPDGVQGYDRYAYVNNSPMKYIDPSGHNPCRGAESGYKCHRDLDKATKGAAQTSNCTLTSIPDYCILNNGAVIDKSHFNTNSAGAVWDSILRGNTA